MAEKAMRRGTDRRYKAKVKEVEENQTVMGLKDYVNDNKNPYLNLYIYKR